MIHECEIILGCTDGGKKLELLNTFTASLTASVCVERVRCRLEFNELSQNTHTSPLGIFRVKDEKAAPHQHSEEKHCHLVECRDHTDQRRGYSESVLFT